MLFTPSPDSFSRAVRVEPLCYLVTLLLVTGFAPTGQANQPPTALQLSNNLVLEGQIIGTTVGNFITLDPDNADSHAYTLVSGEGDTGNAAFTIEGNLLKTAAVLRAETQATYSIRVQTDDGQGGRLTAIFTIKVIPFEPNQPPTGIILQNVFLAENQPTGTVVGRFKTLDPNPSDFHTYRLVDDFGSDDNNLFLIADDQLTTAAVFQFNETDNFYKVRVRAEDGRGGAVEEPLRVEVVRQPGPTLVRTWGSSGDGAGQIAPDSSEVGAGIAVDPLGQVYVADRGNHRLQIFNNQGHLIATIDSFGEGQPFRNPSGVAVDTAGNIYLADSGNQRIHLFSPSLLYLGAFITTDMDTEATYTPLDVAVDSLGNIYVVGNNRIYQYNRAATLQRRFGTGSYNRLTIDAADNIYVSGGSQLEKYNRNGTLLERLGRADTVGVAVDLNGQRYETDPTHHFITMYDSQGNLLTRWGEGWQFRSPSSPSDVTVDELGNIYAIDVGVGVIAQHSFEPSKVVISLTNRTVPENKIGAEVGLLTVNKLPRPQLTLLDDAAGLFVIDADNRLRLQANQAVNHEVQTSYQVTVLHNLSNISQTFVISVTDVNDRPMLVKNQGLVAEQGQLSILSNTHLQATDEDDSAAMLRYTLTQLPEHGMLEKAGQLLLPNNQFTQAEVNQEQISYRHDGSKTTDDHFAFTLSDGRGGSVGVTTFKITVNLDGNAAPTLVTNLVLQVNRGQTATIGSAQLQVTDADNDSDALRYTLLSLPVRGTLTASGQQLGVGSQFSQADIDNNQLIYQHDQSISLSDGFRFMVDDGRGGILPSTLFIISIDLNNRPPIAVNDVITLNEDEPIIANLLANDSDPDGSHLTLFDIGMVKHGVAKIEANQLRYTPTANYNGLDSLRYAVSDGELVSVASVTLTILSVNDPPVAQDDMGSTAANIPLTVAVLANDSDIDGDTLTITQIIGGQASNSIATVSDTTIIVTPAMTFTGVETFSYVVSDGFLTDTATVRLTITTKVNRGPLVMDELVTVLQNSQTSVDVLSNDRDPDGDVLSIKVVGQAAHGQTSLRGEHIQYRPNIDFIGQDQFLYTVSDGQLLSLGQVIINVVDSATLKEQIYLPVLQK